MNDLWNQHIQRESNSFVVLIGILGEKIQEKRKWKENTDRKEGVKATSGSIHVLLFTFLSSIYSAILLLFLLLLFFFFFFLLLPLTTQRGKFNVLYPANSRKSIQYSFSLETSRRCLKDFSKAKKLKQILSS